MLEAMQAIGVSVPTLATMVVNPAASQSPTIFSPSKNVPETATQKKGKRNLIIGGLLATGLAGVVGMFSFGHQTPKSIDVAAPSPESIVVKRSPSPSLQNQTPESIAVKRSPVSQREEVLPSSSPSPIAQNEVTTPTPTQNKANNTQSKVIGFPPGTSENRIKATFGNPKTNTRGIWGNTRAVIYELEPEQITLGYLYDRNSRQIRQTEVAFAQSVASDVMQSTLQGMLGDHFSEDINNGLQQVRQRQTKSYSFNTGNLKGTIERNERDRIYIGVWQADLH
jgi:serine/threonine protein kinase, bacterial